MDTVIFCFSAVVLSSVKVTDLRCLWVVKGSQMLLGQRSEREEIDPRDSGSK